MTRFSCIVFLLSLASCRPSETDVEKGNRLQILHKGNGPEAPELDPQIADGASSLNIISALFEGFVTEDPRDLHPIPGVAENWDIANEGQSYTFHLRHNARWSNGESITAKDFIESYHRILSPALASPVASMLFAVENAEAFNKGTLNDFSQVGFRAPDDWTLEFTLANPTPNFLSLLNHSAWLPVHIPTIKKYGAVFERGNNWTRPGNFVGNGAFTLEQWQANNRVGVKKSPTYWDAAHVGLNGIIFHTTDGNDLEERAFRSGQLHVTDSVPIDRIDRYRKEQPDLLRTDPYLGTYFFRLNVTRPPLNNRLLRRALAMAIDRKSIVENVTRGGQLPATSFTPPNTGGYICLTDIPYDAEQARQLLALAGYPEARGLPPIEILFDDSASQKKVVEAIQQMWQKNLSVRTTLRPQAEKTYLESRQQMNYQVASSSWISHDDDPSSFLDLWATNGRNNLTGWSNSDYDSLIAKAATAANRETRFHIFQQAEAILLADAPVLPIYFNSRAFLIRPNVKGWYPTLLDHHPYKYVRLE